MQLNSPMEIIIVTVDIDMLDEPRGGCHLAGF
jgi:hypothetical protein